MQTVLSVKMKVNIMKQINPFNINWNRILISVLLIAVLILSSIVCSNCNNETKAFDDYEKKTNHLKQENQASENIIALLKVANEELKQENDSISKIKNKVIQEKIKECRVYLKKFSIFTTQIRQD